VTHLKQQLQQFKQAISEEGISDAERLQRDALTLRLHRAISWLDVALEQQDSDQRFINLSIAFSACYQLAPGSVAFDNTAAEQNRFGEFAKMLTSCDSEKKLFDLLWHKYSGPVKSLIKNPYVYALFWQAQRDPNLDWRSAFDASSVAALNALSRKLVPELLAIVLERLFVLRSQVFYGGATYKSQLNREQLQDAVALLEDLLPVIIHLMLENPNLDWGENIYPPISND
jgi:hypothetical protein